jgi:hypothetical protein
MIDFMNITHRRWNWNLALAYDLITVGLERNFGRKQRKLIV